MVNYRNIFTSTSRYAIGSTIGFPSDKGVRGDVIMGVKVILKSTIVFQKLDSLTEKALTSYQKQRYNIRMPFKVPRS